MNGLALRVVVTRKANNMSFLSGTLEPRRMALPPFQEGVDSFIARTYNYFLAALAGISVLGFASYFWLPKTSLGPLALTDSILWILCGWFGWRRPVGFVLPLFCVVTGLLTGQLAHIYPSVFLSATVLTLFTFAGLSVYVHTTRKDYSFLRGFLAVSFILLVGCLLLSFFVQHTIFLLCCTGFGVLSFGCWILYDTSQVIHRADAMLTPGVAAFELILDMIGFHRWLLEHLSIWDLDW